MRILVTGGAGFIGSTLVKRLLKDGHKVAALDNFDRYYQAAFKRENVQAIKNKRFSFYEADVRKFSDVKHLLQGYNFDKIIHLAAQVGVRNSILYPNRYLKTNIEGTGNILELARFLGTKDIIFGSSSSVYGNSSRLPFKEDSPCLKPLNPYAFSKRAAELLCSTYHDLFGLNVTVLRFFSVYGPCGRPDMSPYVFTQSILKGRPITLYGNGEATRDFTYIDDIVEGICLSLKRTFPFEIINLGSSKPVSVLVLIRLLEETLRVKAKIRQVKSIVGEAKDTFADLGKAKKLLGYHVSTDLKNGLREFVTWFKKNRVGESS